MLCYYCYSAIECLVVSLRYIMGTMFCNGALGDEDYIHSEYYVHIKNDYDDDDNNTIYNNT